MSHPWSDEVDTDAVLVGAEAYQRMLDDCEARLQLSASRIEGYEGTRDTLKALLHTCQQDLMVPVAGGLAYFDGTIRHTNNVLVLLGENLFAERSVHDALGVAERRIGYLKAERTALEAEKKEIVDKQRLFVECGVVGSESDNKVGRGRQGRPIGTTQGSATVPTQSKTTSAAVNPQSKDKKETEGSPKATAGDEGGGGGGGEGYEYDELEEEEEEEDDNIIDPQDELTLDELIALEEELGADIDDEEKAEAAIMALVNKKKALRIAQQAAQPNTTATATATATAGSSHQQQYDCVGAVDTFQTQEENHQDPNRRLTCSTTTPDPFSAAQQQCSVESVRTANQAHDDVSESSGVGNTCMSLTAAATAFASPADIGKLFQNIGGAAGDVKDGFEEHLPQHTDVGTYIQSQPSASPPTSSTSASQNPAPAATKAAAAEKAQPAFASSPSVKFSESTMAAAAATPPPSAKEKQSSIETLPPISSIDWFGGGRGGSHHSGGPLKDVIVERNISSCTMVGGEESVTLSGGGGRNSAVVGVHASNVVAASSQPPSASIIGNANSTVNVKKRSLFGQGLGLK